MCLSLILDYEMSTLPKHSSESQGAKIEQEYEVPKVLLAEEKTMEIISNHSSVDSEQNCKATQTEITMETNMWGTLEGPHCSQKGIALWGLQLESVHKHNKTK